MGHPFNNYCEHSVEDIIAAARDQFSDSNSESVDVIVHAFEEPEA